MPSSSRASHYHRFIPSEEVQEVASWEFKPVDGSLEDTPEAAPAEPELSAELLEDIRQQAHQDGFEQGRRAGAQEAKEAYDRQLQTRSLEQAQRVGQLLEQAMQHFDQLEHQLAGQVLELACDIARQVVRRELSVPTEPLLAVIHEALSVALEDGRPATLRLHPDDAALVKPLWDHGQPAPHVRLETDPQITPGGCVVDSAQGVVDGRLEKRWARAVANLGMNVPWQPGEDADV